MVRGGWFTSSAIDHLVEGQHADAKYTRDCNYRLISFSMLLHVSFTFFSSTLCRLFFFFFYSLVPFTSIITEVSYVGTFFFVFFLYMYMHYLSLSADRGIFPFVGRTSFFSVFKIRIRIHFLIRCVSLWGYWRWSSMNFELILKGENDGERECVATHNDSGQMQSQFNLCSTKSN